jgi:hypothetical protein
MFKIKKKVEKPKLPVLYNVIEDYSEFDAPHHGLRDDTSGRSASHADLSAMECRWLMTVADRAGSVYQRAGSERGLLPV